MLPLARVIDTARRALLYSPRRSHAIRFVSPTRPTMRKQHRYVIKFGRVILPRSKYHSTKKGAKGYNRLRMKRLTRRERDESGGRA
jgi:hypothetical protein